MSRFGLLRSLIAFVVFIGLALTPDPAFAQRGGGGHGGGGGGGGSHGGPEAVASMVVADLMAAEDIVVAAPMAARGPMEEEVTPKAAGLKLAAIPARWEIVRQEISRRIIVPQSTMASGIRSAAPVVPRV